MSEAERISHLEAKIEDLQRQVQELAISHLQGIVLLRSLMIGNKINPIVEHGSKTTDVFEEYGHLFDKTYDVLMSPTGPSK